MTNPDAMLESVLRRDRLVLVVLLGAVAAAAWLWLLLGAGIGISSSATAAGSSMAEMPGMTASMPNMVMDHAVWTTGYAALMFSMWWVMMTAMMLPSAAPVLLLFARVSRAGSSHPGPYVATIVFAAGYLALWGGFSALAAGLQWGLERLDWLSPMMATTNWALGAAIVIAAGLWQLTAIKSVCLRQCRSPLGFLTRSWRPGRRGAFVMGLQHGGYCLGCCWFLMTLLFFGGAMNLFWIAGLAVFVMVEKTLRFGRRVGQVAGIAAIAWGVEMLIQAP